MLFRSVEPSKNAVNKAPVYKKSDSSRQSAKEGVEYIHHPQAAKGLLRIEKDGTYVYRTKEDLSYSQTGTFKVGSMMDAPRIATSDGSGITFDSMYHGSPVPVLMFDYQWQPWSTFGRFGFQLGIDFLFAQGSGHFADGSEAREQYTFVAIPVSAGIVYRLEWMSRQWLAPYVSGGGTLIPLVEFRDDDSSPNATGTYGEIGRAHV